MVPPATYEELLSSAAQFRTTGVAFIPSLLDAATLESLRNALPATLQGAASSAKAAQVGWRSPGYFDAPFLLESPGRECLRLLEDPRLVGLLQSAVGSDAHLINLQASSGVLEDTRIQREYWRDDGNGALQRGSFLHPVLSEGVKVIIALTDQDSCVTYLPSSNRSAEETLDAAAPAGSLRLWKAKRGDAMVLDVRTYHSAFSPGLAEGSLILCLLRYATLQYDEYLHVSTAISK